MGKSMIKTIRRWFRSLLRRKAPTHVGIYYYKAHDDNHRFVFRMGQKGLFEEKKISDHLLRHPMELIHLDEIPAEYIPSVQSHVALWTRSPIWLDDEFHRQMGHIHFQEVPPATYPEAKLPPDARIVQTTEVYPRSENLKSTPEDIAFGKQTPGWGAHLEAVCAGMLEKLGITHIATSQSPEGNRPRAQINAGLKLFHPYPLEEWKNKKEKYYQKKLAEYRKTRMQADTT